MSRIGSQSGRLARLGFADAAASAELVAAWTNHGTSAQIDAALTELQCAADPDLALAGLNNLVHARPDLFELLAANEVLIHRLAAVLGASVALNQHLCANPGDLEVLCGAVDRRSLAELRAELLAAVGADPDLSEPVADHTRSDDLRRGYRRALLRIAARDLTSADLLAVLPDIAAELADLADATVEAALALARGEVTDWQRCRIGVLALGKTGAGELNYVSDVDVLYVGEPAIGADGEPVCDPGTAIQVATRMATALTRICSAHTGAGTIWPIDAALRPEGKAGALVRTLASHRAYYEKWAKNWEFQAMLKARPMAGDLSLAQEFVDMVWPMVWRVADNDQFVAETQAMRLRVISLLPSRDANHEIKLGAGGLRDVEFSVQLLQLVHGRSDERLRLRGTFEALTALVDHGYVGRADGFDLGTAYRLQRLLEHRIQLYRLRRTHLMPADDVSQRWLARSIGLAETEELMHLWRATTRRVLRLHQRLFYSPLLAAVARIPSAEVGLTSEEAETRLRALGYGDAKAALRHIEALSAGMTRSAEIQRQLLPAMLGWLTAGPNPDHGLLAFRQVSEELGATPWYLRTMRDGDAMAEHLARILASSRYAVDLLMRAPQNAALLGDAEGLAPRTFDDIVAEMRTAARRHDKPEEAVATIRASRRAELLRLAMADLLGEIEISELGVALSAVVAATIEASLEVASRGLSLPPLAVVALGRWGGAELSYASDADAMFVLADSDNQAAIGNATTAISRLRALLAKPGPDPALEIDIDLRPEGKQGAIVRSLASYRAYYQRWSSTWEAQALLRAAAGAGDAEVSAELLASIDPIRYPVGGLTTTQVHEIRKLKGRMEAERAPRSGDASRNIKLGPGGLSDVEWVVQLIQLRHGAEIPALRTPNTLAGLAAAAEAELLDPADADSLRQAWKYASRIRNAVMLLRGRASDNLPTDVRDLSAVAQILGYAKGESSLLVQEQSRRARLVRQVMDRTFWSND
ncbi:bifunctional [glutamine synthetase] adenylyltransferase/[glutamine synthetase]-adenylyl-L-tyrosine phosphorylase [Propionicimonas sp.]|uniref:bifunctional [glutamine synthetase] adenylyltransferase/[glutamine synthetase]-adenylyl-L-tyrosine phosphorylase n=1 Tax=Propionicimonas sp. TaxID=1955623 RepID=UPI0018463821|nr:bifunctional [glutamine synthetase] adenylyltransferase/[glutamine synthetase]-adenylyl-L-tyrosine phosphorylase [Propionicimonas sp.]MBU3977928.1 bifunctional [glutamine synthetase] adenylyltransferase/[glutamine synthetase]-adenylyl-L-tyrosine phosphorylase [Actinomycetota bacterium]MBA3021849.1 bifunctional [glutamine synthetase] adenylyltransferase/[glutamine synthetase]-adenylyl-L-tyrosine phosphorylase [Propionicimonas sp.]MBU3985372.1 bifunctional [glutamine synthetase] adenylyltransfe